MILYGASGHAKVICDYCHIVPYVHVSGGIIIGEDSWLGVGSCVKQGVKICKWVTIGAGSVLVKDTPKGVTAYVCPCREIISNDNNMTMNKLHPLGEGEQVEFTIQEKEGRRICHAA